MSNIKQFNAISASGTMDNLLYIGFSYRDALVELIDNSISAGANNIKLFFLQEQLLQKKMACLMKKS
jgi:hypothetical protein